jgi:hypothetical protein
MNQHTHNELTKMEAKEAGLTVQELCKQKVILKRQLRQLGFTVEPAPQYFYSLALLQSAIAFHGFKGNKEAFEKLAIKYC